jgi:hypothetical protein
MGEFIWDGIYRCTANGCRCGGPVRYPSGDASPGCAVPDPEAREACVVCGWERGVQLRPVPAAGPVVLPVFLGSRP